MRATTPSSPAHSSDPSHGSSGLFEDNTLDLVSDVVKAVDHRLEMIVDLLPCNEGHGVRLRVLPIEFTQALVVNVIGPAFDFGYPLAQRANAGGFGADVPE